MTHQKQKKEKIDNTFAAYRWNVDCCETIITIFIFYCFWCAIMPLTGFSPVSPKPHSPKPV